MTKKARLATSAGGWVVDVTPHGSEYPDRRFYVGLTDSDAAVEAVRAALKFDGGHIIRASRRILKQHAEMLELRPGELRLI